MEEVKTTGRRLLAMWRGQFQATGVPEQLIAQIEAHQKELPLRQGLLA